MTGQADEGDESLRAAVALAAGNARFLQEIRGVLDRAQSDLADLQPTCRACGTCCDFAAAGHRLYVTTGELALLSLAPPADAAPPPLRCPYQDGPACAARELRPLGCRTYFCDGPSTDRCRELHERLHAEIRRLHGRRTIPYHYVELTAALAAH